MRDLLTPKQISRAIKVSESSVKRWCDKGLIPTQYTAGGHRRIPMSGLLDFLKSSNYQLQEPEVLGLPATIGRGSRVIDRATTAMVDSMVLGEEESCRQIALDLFLAEHRLSTICDRLFAASFEAIGQQWQCGEAEIYQERRGCEIALRLLHELRALVGQPSPQAPLAIGGAVEGDQYSLATSMVELVLRDLGFYAVSLGDNLPLATLGAAIREQKPRLFWLSCSHILDQDAFLTEYRSLHDEFGTTVPFVVGGRALTASMRRSMSYSAYCENMEQLESCVQTLA